MVLGKLLGEKRHQRFYPELNPGCYNTDMPDKMGLLEKMFMQLRRFANEISGLQQKTEVTSDNLAWLKPWRGMS